MTKMNLEHNTEQLSHLVKFCTCSQQNCSCEGKNEHEWTWDETLASPTSELSNHNLEVKFHPEYSNGTAMIRGNIPMSKGKHHFWEIKMMTRVYGTDVMIGVGTNKVDLTGTRETYCSLLGRDGESWGFSYRGYIQHNNKTHDYATCFKQGSLIGIHLDTWRGTLQFLLNRKPLGVAFTGLRDVILYPMVSSTAANSTMRITHSCSVPVSLQMDCLSVLKPFQRAYLSAAFPGLRYLSESIFVDILKRHIDDEDEDEIIEFPAEFTILDDFDFALVGLGRKRKKKCAENN